jgi:steroid delta-isomerase-like uncharacterized protein
MSAKQNEAILQHIFKELNKGNIDIVDELFADDFVDRYPVPGETPDREGFKQFLSGLHKSFPDWRWNLEDIFSEGDKVAYRFTMKGTDKGGYIGLPPTGKKINFAGIGILRFANSKVAERWTIGDSMTLLHQLGII